MIKNILVGTMLGMVLASKDVHENHGPKGIIAIPIGSFQ
jgi:hypothetical protein